MSLIKTFVVVIALLILAGTGWLIYDALTADRIITSFSDCLAAGYPALDTSPRQCQTADGQIFIEETDPTTIDSFAECLAGGFAVRESYPRQCQTPDGRVFIENIGNENELLDLIRLNTPRPGSEVTSPLAITGQARGTWFFEANFPVALFDDNGKELARSFASAKDDWMTEEFVSFSANLEFSRPTTATGTLILERANPSGLEEQANSLIIPINFTEVTTPTDPTSRAKDGCIITGCSSQICSDQEVVTTCEYLPEYACYQSAICGRGPTGQCQWQDSPALAQCLEDLSTN
ncbi:MAG: Gmad2 immunoglobulin-like domain-containing protein [Candidatus Paceibacterota bacterium]